MNTVPLHDIADCEGYVRAAIAKTNLRLEQAERDELVCEGLVILCDLGRRFKPRMEGYDRDGSFAGWASRLLPLKLVSAWHGLHPEHVLRTQPDGTRKYEYHDAADSLDAKLEANERASAGERFGITGAMAIREDRLRTPGDFASTLYQPKEAAA